MALRRFHHVVLQTCLGATSISARPMVVSPALDDVNCLVEPGGDTVVISGNYGVSAGLADGGEVPWGEEPPFRAPVFVVTHRHSETLVRKGGTSFTFVTDGVASAVDQARAAAGGKNVAVAGGGSLVRQVLAAGLLDELELHIIPVVLGTGLRLLDAELGLDEMEGIELTPTRVVHSPAIRYQVDGPARLVLDNRGRE